MRPILPLPLLAAAALSACTDSPGPHGAPQPSAPPPVTPEAPEPDWRDLPLSPGGWRYMAESGGSAARFGVAGAPSALVIRCERAARAVRIVRAGAAAGAMTIKTSYGPRDVAVTAGPEGMTATFAANDTLLDRIAFSRGRVTYALAGLPLLVTPAWAEPARVIEDCRG